MVFILSVGALAAAAAFLEHTGDIPSEAQTAQVAQHSTLLPYTLEVPTPEKPEQTVASSTKIKQPAAEAQTPEPPERVATVTEAANEPRYVTITIPAPYDVPPTAFDTLNTATLPAVVNILCGATRASAFSGATGSGIIIDPRGVILTNAHVAQYLLLQSHPNADIRCTIRTGIPAQPAYHAQILAFPEAWVQEHAGDIREEYPVGTGEHDWALLYITESATEQPLPKTFPFVSLDTREGIAQAGQQVLLAAYPSGFLDSATLQRNLWPVTSVGQVKNVYTFATSTIDVLSFGGTIVAQGGASGGGALNAWGKLVGILTTSSMGPTTDDRDLRAISLAHINRSISVHTGGTLQAFLSAGGFAERANDFTANTAPQLLEYYDN